MKPLFLLTMDSPLAGTKATLVASRQEAEAALRAYAVAEAGAEPDLDEPISELAERLANCEHEVRSFICADGVGGGTQILPEILPE